MFAIHYRILHRLDRSAEIYDRRLETICEAGVRIFKGRRRRLGCAVVMFRRGELGQIVLFFVVKILTHKRRQIFT